MQRQIQNLCRTRDLLLSRLLSWQVNLKAETSHAARLKSAGYST
jgi:hypothetical protein